MKSEGPLSLSTLMEESEICASNDHFRISLQKCNDEKALSNGPQSKTPHLNLEDGEYNAKMEEFQLQLANVRKMVRPGCSQEVLDFALPSMASLVKTLSIMSTSESYLHASL